MIDTKKLDPQIARTFMAVISSGSVELAAVELGKSQQCVIDDIDKLESVADGLLFDRSASSWVISPDGEKLLNLLEGVYRYVGGRLEPRKQRRVTPCALRCVLHWTEKRHN